MLAPARPHARVYFAHIIGESTSTPLFAQRIKKLQLNASRREVMGTEGLLEHHRKEIEELRKRLSEREADAPVRTRRLSARQLDEQPERAHPPKLVLTNESVDETKGNDSCAASPAKVDFDMIPYHLLAARCRMKT
ncbi:hypothetical protein B0H21DRAFT_825724 [Amylocystis lapponica]|nr:hypothetical protein B0H21DRAFT_825724 [Amylocystis lapponica]